MKVMVIVKASKSSEAGQMPSTELLAAMGQYNEQLAKAGILLDGAGLTPSARGVRVRFSGASRTVTDGPFAETKELIAGYWVWQVKSLEEAIAWVKKCPNPMGEDSDIEIRPFFKLEDFSEALTPELREQEAAIRAISLGFDAPRFVNGPPMKIAGLNAHYDMETRVGIPQQWKQFVPRSRTLGHDVGVTCYGVCWNSTSDCGFDYLTGVEVAEEANLPPDFTCLTIHPRRYAIFRHLGHVSTLVQLIDDLWMKWAPASGLTFSHDPWFERYTDEFNPQTGTGGMELWIPFQTE